MSSTISWACLFLLATLPDSFGNVPVGLCPEACLSNDLAALVNPVWLIA